MGWVMSRCGAETGLLLWVTRKGENNPRTQSNCRKKLTKKKKNPQKTAALLSALCSAVPLACLENVPRLCLANSLRDRRGVSGGCRAQPRRPQSTREAPRDASLRALTGGTAPAPLTASLSPLRRALLPPPVLGSSITPRSLPSSPLFERAGPGIPAGCSSWVLSPCTSSSLSHLTAIPGALVAVIYVCEECSAPTSSWCDTATELAALCPSCCNIPALCTSLSPHGFSEAPVRGLLLNLPELFLGISFPFCFKLGLQRQVVSELWHGGCGSSCWSCTELGMTQKRLRHLPSG